MPKHDNPFADLPPITDFESSQRVRLLVLQRLGQLLCVWDGCENKACVRAQSCRRGDGACLRSFMQAVPDEERRALRYTLENRRKGLPPGEAGRLAEARIAEERARDEA